MSIRAFSARHPALSSLAAGVVGGAVSAALHTPLPWMIGPLLAMALLKFAGFDLRAPRAARESGQLIIATALGLYFTPVVSGEVLGRWELLIAAALFATVLAYIGAFVLSRFSDTDRTTALFASVPGGATEMMILGERFGAKPDRIALAQTLRILLVVLIVPFSFAALGVHGGDLYQPVAASIAPVKLALLLACCACGGLAFALVRLPNAWMLGPLVVSVALTASGVQWSAMPSALTNVGQVLIGCTLGARFEREFMRRAPRFVVVVVASALVAMAVSALFAVGLARLGAVAVPTMVLATAPGGIAEMCITAKVLQLGVPLVTAAHVTRVIMLVTMTAPLFRAARRLRSVLRPR